MNDMSASGMAYNRFDNLDSIEDRIIYYLLSPANKSQRELEQVHNIWKILYYNDIDALNKPLPKYSDIVKLIDNGEKSQNNYRIFRSPRLEDSWTEECTLLKVYIDSIIPDDHLRSVVNVGIDIVVNTKIINLRVPDDEKNVFIDMVDDIPIKIQTKSRVSAMLKSILMLCNGASVAGIGRMVFSRKQSIFNTAQYGLWNNRNFEGIKLVIGVSMSGVS